MPELSTLGSTIKIAYENEANTNAFTDAEKNKLAGITVNPSIDDVDGLPEALDQKANILDVNRGAASSAGALLAKLAEGLRDATVLILGDSTSNETTEWVYLYAQWLASNYPAYTVNYYLWGGADYNTAVEVQSGSGTSVLSIYNCSIPGARPTTFSGHLLHDAVQGIPKADLVFINLGLNLTTGLSNASIETVGVPQFLELCSSVLTSHAAAGLLFLTQNPYRDDTTFLKTYSAITGAAALLNAEIADSYVEFIRQGKPAGLYNDNIHPSSLGTQIYLDAVKRTHATLTPKAANNILSYGYNILANGNFSNFDPPAVPAGWTAVNAEFAKETSVSEGPNGYSVSITRAAPGSQSYIYQNLPAADLRLARGGWLTLAVRMFIPPSETSATIGRIALVTSEQTNNSYPPYGDGRDHWIWRMLSVYVAPNAVYVSVRIYLDTAASDAGNIYVDRAVLVRGRTPADIY